MGAFMSTFQINSKHSGAECFEACCQWALLNLLIISQATVDIYCIEICLSCCNYMNGNLEILKVQVNGPFTQERGEQTGEKPRKPVQKSVSHIRGGNSPPQPHPLILVISSLALTWSEHACSDRQQLS